MIDKLRRKFLKQFWRLIDEQQSFLEFLNFSGNVFWQLVFLI